MRRILAACTVVALFGCGSGDSAPSLSGTLTGSTWATSGGKFQVYRDDGTYGVGSTRDSARGDVAEADTEWGTWSVESNVLTLQPDPSSPFCADVTGVYDIEVTDDGAGLDVAVQDDTCELRSRDMARGLNQVDG